MELSSCKFITNINVWITHFIILSFGISARIANPHENIFQNYFKKLIIHRIVIFEFIPANS